MSATVRYIGLDVHKDSIVIAVAEDGVQPAEFLTKLPYDIPRLLKQLRKLGSPARLRCCYEAGPTGYGLYRALSAAGLACLVVAPSLIPVKSGNRVKTDRRDARKLAHYLRSGDLTAVWVPDEASEAMRDLERARDDAKRSERVARQQLGKFLLRHDRRFPGKTSWTRRHLAWIVTQKFAHEAQQQVLTDYLHTVEEATTRVQRLSEQIAKLVEGWALAPLVKALMAMRGVQLITAVTVAAEIGDLKRFRKAGQLMSFVGAVPSERSSGDSRRQGRITKTGNAHDTSRAGRSGLDVPASSSPEPGHPQTQRRTSAPGAGHRLEGPGAAERALSSHARGRQGAQRHAHRRGPRTGGFRLGRGAASGKSDGASIAGGFDPGPRRLRNLPSQVFLRRPPGQSRPLAPAEATPERAVGNTAGQ